MSIQNNFFWLVLYSFSPTGTGRFDNDVLTNYFKLSNSNVEILLLENSPLFNDLWKAANPRDISVFTFHDFTKFRIPPPLSFELEKILGIFPYPGAENLIHPLVFSNIFPWLARGPTPGASP